MTTTNLDTYFDEIYEGKHRTKIDWFNVMNIDIIDMITDFECFKMFDAPGERFMAQEDIDSLGYLIHMSLKGKTDARFAKLAEDPDVWYAIIGKRY